MLAACPDYAHRRCRTLSARAASADATSSTAAESAAKSAAAVAPAAAPRTCRMWDVELTLSTIQHMTPISIIETPIVFRMSTRSRSLHGAHPQAMRYSCKRNNRPSPRISAPRRIVVSAIAFGVAPFCRNLSVTRANEIPARNRNNGAGKVPPSCDHMKKVDLRASGLSQES